MVRIRAANNASRQVLTPPGYERSVTQLTCARALITAPAILGTAAPSTMQLILLLSDRHLALMSLREGIDHCIGCSWDLSLLPRAHPWLTQTHLPAVIHRRNSLLMKDISGYAL